MFVLGVARNNSVDSGGSLRTFRPGPTPSGDPLRTGSPSRAAPPNLADLDFPPPPTDLPPPTEESPPSPAPGRRPPLPSSPRTVRNQAQPNDQPNKIPSQVIL